MFFIICSREKLLQQLNTASLSNWRKYDRLKKQANLWLQADPQITKQGEGLNVDVKLKYLEYYLKIFECMLFPKL